jgi:hypothetical protein
MCVLQPVINRLAYYNIFNCGLKEFYETAPVADFMNSFGLIYAISGITESILKPKRRKQRKLCRKKSYETGQGELKVRKYNNLIVFVRKVVA